MAIEVVVEAGNSYIGGRKCAGWRLEFFYNAHAMEWVSKRRLLSVYI